MGSGDVVHGHKYAYILYICCTQAGKGIFCLVNNNKNGSTWRSLCSVWRQVCPDGLSPYTRVLRLILSFSFLKASLSLFLYFLNIYRTPGGTQQESLPSTITHFLDHFCYGKSLTSLLDYQFFVCLILKQTDKDHVKSFLHFFVLHLIIS